jgi:hypothetical protein
MASDEALKEGQISAKIMREAFRSFGLSDEEANEKIGGLIHKVQASNGSFQLIRIRDVVYTADVTGKNTVEIHAMPGGSIKQNHKYRVKKLEDTLPNVMSVLYQMGVEVIYVTMPKKEAQPYDKMMNEFGFEKVDIPEDTGAKDLIAYIVRIK